MKTKIVYVVASHADDYYMEQAFVSAWSVRHYNSNCLIEIVCDQDTMNTFDSGVRAQYKYLFDKFIVLDFQEEQCIMERSRSMKTRLREIVEGDFLYLDTDTIVCGDLSCVDGFNFDLGLVSDCNCEFGKFINWKVVVSRTRRLYDVDISAETRYFNSGVIYAKDCKSTHSFYRYWNELWKGRIAEPDGLKDQCALAVANIKCNHLIYEMSGDFNCQIKASIQYLHTSKVIHYFNCMFPELEGLNPFYSDSIFENVRNNGITEDIQFKILNNKSLFSSPSVLVDCEVVMLWRKFLDTTSEREFEEKVKSTNSYSVISYTWRHFPIIMRFNEYILEVVIRLYKRAIRLFL